MSHVGLRRGLAVALVLSAGAARAAPLAIQIYRLSAEGPPSSATADAQALLVSSVPAAIRRSERMIPGKKLFLPPTCGGVPELACLAQLAGDGVVISGRVREVGAAMAVTLQAVDGAGRVHGPVQVTVDTFLQSSAPFTAALLELERRVPASVGKGVAPGAPAPVAAVPPPAPARAATPAPAPTPSPAAQVDLSAPPPAGAPRSSAAALYRAPRPAPAGAWRRAAGQWTAGAGLALLAGGATFAVLNQQLAKDLDGRFSRNELTRSDASKYDRVDTYNVLATTMLIAGGVATVTGAVLWSTAPEITPLPGGASVGVRRSF